MISWFTRLLSRLIYLLLRSISGSIREISDVAQSLAGGNLTQRVRDIPPDEVGTLAQSLNTLASQMEKVITNLKQDRSQLAAVLNNMEEAVIAVDPTQRILVANPAFTKLFAGVCADVVGKPLLEALRNKEIVEIILHVIATHEKKSAELTVYSPQISTFIAHAAPLPIADKGVGALLVLYDITQLRKLEQVRKDFVANVSHELQTPLSAIKGFAETLLDGALDDIVHRKEFVEAIVKHADALTEMVDDLLQIARLESGEQRSARRRVSLAKLMQQAIATIEPFAKKARVAISVQGIEALPEIEGEPIQLEQAFRNLLDNGVKFNREGGKIQVVGSHSDGDFIQIIFEDTGQGIPADDLPRIFERFYRVEKARTREKGGTGLGLSIVKHIVEGHGGKISVESTEGSGTKFTLVLPVNAKK